MSRAKFSRPMIKAFCNDVGEAMGDTCRGLRNMAICPHARQAFHSTLCQKEQTRLIAILAAITEVPACKCRKCSAGTDADSLHADSLLAIMDAATVSENTQSTVLDSQDFESQPAESPPTESPPSASLEEELEELLESTGALKKQVVIVESHV